jgi:glycosyltransferase involved in cell wall biosynthesis
MTETDRRMRVLMVTPRFSPYVGGIETHVREVASRLARSGVAITVLTTDPAGQLPSQELLDGVEVRRVRAWPARRDYYFAPDVARVIRGRRWDLLHCQGCHTLVPPLAMTAARQARMPYLVSLHTGGSSSRLRHTLRGLQWRAMRPLLDHAERVVGASAWEVERFQRLLRIPRSRFAVIPNGTNFTTRHTAASHNGHHPVGRKLIASIGRLERYKGHQHVIAAMPLILAREPDAYLRVVGDGPYASALRQLVARLGLEDRVEIRGVPAGSEPAMAAILADAAVVTLLSEYESHGIAIVDALGLGRPVVVAANSALQEYVRCGQAIGVASPQHPEEVTAAILRQLTDPLVPSELDVPTWDTCAADLLGTYRAIMEEGGRAR